MGVHEVSKASRGVPKSSKIFRRVPAVSQGFQGRSKCVLGGLLRLQGSQWHSRVVPGGFMGGPWGSRGVSGASRDISEGFRDF